MKPFVSILTLICYLLVPVCGPPARASESAIDETLARFCAEQMEVAKSFPAGMPAFTALARLFQKEAARWRAALGVYPKHPLSPPLATKWRGATTYFWHTASDPVEREIPDPESCDAVERRLSALVRAEFESGETSVASQTFVLNDPLSVATRFTPGLVAEKQHESRQGLGRLAPLRKWALPIAPFFLAAILGLYTAHEGRRVEASHAAVAAQKQVLIEQIVHEKKSEMAPRLNRDRLLEEAKLYGQSGWKANAYHFPPDVLRDVHQTAEAHSKQSFANSVVEKYQQTYDKYTIEELSRLVEKWEKDRISYASSSAFYDTDMRKVLVANADRRIQAPYILSIIFEVFFTIVGILLVSRKLIQISRETAPALPKISLDVLKDYLSKSDVPPHFASFLKWLVQLRHQGALPLQTGYFGITTPTGVHLDIVAEYTHTGNSLKMTTILWKRPLDFIEPGDGARGQFQNGESAPKQVSVNLTEYWRDLVQRIQERYALVPTEMTPFRSVMNPIKDLSFARGDLRTLDTLVDGVLERTDSTSEECLTKMQEWVTARQETTK